VGTWCAALAAAGKSARCLFQSLDCCGCAAHLLGCWLAHSLPSPPAPAWPKKLGGLGKLGITSRTRLAWLCGLRLYLSCRAGSRLLSTSYKRSHDEMTCIEGRDCHICIFACSIESEIIPLFSLLSSLRLLLVLVGL
jgi:hypothetical protein